MAESLRVRRSDPEFHSKLWAEGSHVAEREKLRLKGPHLQTPHPRGVPDTSPDEGVSEGPWQLRAQLRELHEAMLACVLCGEGLSGVARLAAEASGAPVVIAVPDLITVAMPTGAVDDGTLAELEQRARERTPGRLVAARDDLLIELPLQIVDEPVGLIALCAADGTAAPTASWILDIAGSAALTAVAIERARLDAEHRLRGSFLDQLRSGVGMSSAEITRRARRLGCEIAAGGVILCVEVEGGRPLMVASLVASEYPGAFAEPIDLGTAEQEAPPQVWAVLPAIDDEHAVAAATEAAAKKLATRLRQYGPVGISRFHTDPSEFGRALEEAELMVEVIRRAVVPAGDEIGDGTYKLLFRLLASHPGELSNYHDSTIAPLVQHDEQYRTDLIRTLEAYLETNCNMNLTADTIFAHRHTVAHRLERIHELTGLDASLHEDRERLGLGLKIHRLMVA